MEDCCENTNPRIEPLELVEVEMTSNYQQILDAEVTKLI
jgi:hypothetical protein